MDKLCFRIFLALVSLVVLAEAGFLGKLFKRMTSRPGCSCPCRNYWVTKCTFTGVKEECRAKPGYEYHKDCTQRPVVEPVKVKVTECQRCQRFYEDVLDITLVRQCGPVYDEHCKTKYPRQCFTERKCTMVYVTECESGDEHHHSQYHPRRKYQQKCSQVPKQTCLDIVKCHRTPKTQCHSVTKQNCKKVPHPVKKKEMRHRCLPFDKPKQKSLYDCSGVTPAQLLLSGDQSSVPALIPKVSLSPANALRLKLSGIGEEEVRDSVVQHGGLQEVAKLTDNGRNPAGLTQALAPQLAQAQLAQFALGQQGPGTGLSQAQLGQALQGAGAGQGVINQAANPNVVQQALNPPPGPSIPQAAVSQGGVNLPPGITLPPGVTLPPGINIPPGVTVPPGFQIPEGIDLASLPPDIRNNLFGPSKRQAVPPDQRHRQGGTTVDREFRPSIRLPNGLDPSIFNLPLEESYRIVKAMQKKNDQSATERIDLDAFPDQTTDEPRRNRQPKRIDDEASPAPPTATTTNVGKDVDKGTEEEKEEEDFPSDDITGPSEGSPGQTPKAGEVLTAKDEELIKFILESSKESTAPADEDTIAEDEPPAPPVDSAGDGEDAGEDASSGGADTVTSKDLKESGGKTDKRVKVRRRRKRKRNRKRKERVN